MLHKREFSTNQPGHNDETTQEYDPNRFLRKDGDAIVTSVSGIDQSTWKDFLGQNWDRLMVNGTTMLVLTGVHGRPDGQLGPADQDQLEQDRPMKQFLYRTHKEDVGEENVNCSKMNIRDICREYFKVSKKDVDSTNVQQQSQSKNVEIVIMDLGRVCEEYFRKREMGFCPKENLEMLKQRLTKQIQQWEELIGKKFTSILFAYCYTQWNVITDLLRLEPSLCSRYTVERDNVSLFGRRVQWGEEQEAALEWVAKNPTEHVIFTGDYGTGKTLLAVEGAKIKFAHYRTMESKSVQLVVAVTKGYEGETHEELDHSKQPDFLQANLSQLLRAWKEKVTIFKDEGKSNNKFKRGMLRAYLQRLRRRKDKGEKRQKTIFVIDEVPANWVNEKSLKDLLWEDEDIILVARPAGEVRSEKWLPKRLHLTKNYRNSLRINQLHEAIKTHQSRQNYSNPVQHKFEHVQGREEDYPPGTTPVWVVVTDETVTEEEAVEFLRLQDPSYEERLKDGMYQICRVDARLKPDNCRIRGSEWPTMVVQILDPDWPKRMLDRQLWRQNLFEAITRARSHLFILTPAGHEVFAHAYNHIRDDFDCCACSNSEGPSYLGNKLLEKAFGGRGIIKRPGGQLRLEEIKQPSRDNKCSNERRQPNSNHHIKKTISASIIDDLRNTFYESVFYLGIDLLEEVTEWILGHD